MKNRVYYKDLKAGDSQVVKLLDDFDAAYNFVGNEGNRFWFQTDLNRRAERCRDRRRNSARNNWKVIVPESERRITVGQRRGQQVHSQLSERRLTRRSEFTTQRASSRAKVSLPGIGSAGGFGGKAKDKETFYYFTGFTTPTTIYRYDMTTGKSTIFREPKVEFNPADYETKQVFYNEQRRHEGADVHHAQERF